jgi:hypothetical protein
MLDNTLHMAVLGLELAGLSYLVFGKMPRRIYRLIMRAITGVFIEIDPIGILKDKILEAKKKRDELNDDVGKVRGSKQTLIDIIEKNKKTIAQDLALAAEAKRRSTDPQLDLASQTRMQYEVRLRANDVGRLQNSNQNYSALLLKVSELYDRLVKLSAGVDFFIADLEGTVREEEIKYKTINSAWSAFSKAMSIIRGNADEDDLYQQDLEYLADNASMKLGQIEDMTRLSQHFMDSIDLQSGAMDTKAAEELDQYQQKLLTSGDAGSISIVTGATVVPQVQAVPIDRKTGTDYFKR